MNFVLFITSILPPIFISLIIKIYYKKLNKLMLSVLFATLLHQILLVSFPVLYSIYNDFEQESLLSINVSTMDLINVMVGEVIYVFSFMIIFISGLGIRKSWINKTRDNPKNIRFNSIGERLFFLIILSIGAFYFLTQLLTLGLSISNPLFLQLNKLFGVLFSYSPIIASAFVITKKGFYKNYPFLFMLAFLCLSSLTIIAILSATRGRIMWIASLIIIMSYLNNQKKYIIYSIISLFIFLPFFSFLGKFKSIAATEIVSGGNTLGLVKILFEERGAVADLIENNDSSFLDSFSNRAQGPRNSVVLYNSYNDGTSPNGRIYLGSIFFLVPRVLWPNKPIPGSIDSDENNSAVFKVMSYGHGLPYMGPILASAHAYWEGGYLAVLFHGMIVGFLWIAIFLFSRKVSYNVFIIIAITFSAALLIDGFLTIFAPLYAYILIFWKWVIPVALLYLILKAFSTNRSISK